MKESVVVDFAEPRPAVLILWPVAVILDAETSNFLGAFLDVGNGV
jgi:hypothetical protein